MRLKPRHYILCAVIITIFVVNIVRNRHRQTVTNAPPARVVMGPRIDTPAWAAFDAAASFRDAPDAQFQPALHDLQQQLDAMHDATATPLTGCKTWLLFYRQSVLHPSKNLEWKTRSTQHVNGCIKYHADTSI